MNNGYTYYRSFIDIKLVFRESLFSFRTNDAGSSKTAFLGRDELSKESLVTDERNGPRQIAKFSNFQSFLFLKTLLRWDLRKMCSTRSGNARIN